MVKMVLGSSDKQGSTMSSVAQARVAAYNQAISALTNFNGTGELTGAAYDSGKNYGMSTIIPLIKGALMYAESLGESVPKLPSKYRAEVCGEDLDSAELERDIRGLESSLAGLRGVYRAMEKNDDVSPSSLQSISARMDDLTSEKNEKMEQLRKLNLFAGSSNAVFGGEDGIKSIDGLLGNIVTGINQVQTEFANFGGTFPSHSNDMEWAKNIEGEWTKKAEIDKNYQKVLKKLDDGKQLDEKDIKAIQAYQSRYPARDLPENIKNGIQDFVDRKEAELQALAQKVADEQGISVEEAFEWILNKIELGEKSSDTISKFGNLYDKFITAKNELDLINGRPIAVDSRGRVKIGSRFYYNKNTGHVYTSGSEEYSQETGRNFDHAETNIGKGVQTTGWRAALGDAVDSAKRSFKQNIQFWKLDSGFWDDFKWKDASKLSKWGKAGKLFGAFGTVLNIGGNIKENFLDDKTSSVGEKIRNFAVDQGVDLLAGASAASAGAAIGTFIGGPIGTVAGFALGAAIGYAMDNFKINELNNQSITDAAKDALIKTTDAIGDGLKTIGGWFS